MSELLLTDEVPSALEPPVFIFDPENMTATEIDPEDFIRVVPEGG